MQRREVVEACSASRARESVCEAWRDWRRVWIEVGVGAVDGRGRVRFFVVVSKLHGMRLRSSSRLGVESEGTYLIVCQSNPFV